MISDPVIAEQLATSYHLDEMDDELAVEEDDEDEDMMMDTGGNDLQRNRSFSAITPDQLAAAIAAAQAGAQGGSGGSSAGRGQNPGAAGLFGMTGKLVLSFEYRNMQFTSPAVCTERGVRSFARF